MTVFERWCRERQATLDLVLRRDTSLSKSSFLKTLRSCFSNIMMVIIISLVEEALIKQLGELERVWRMVFKEMFVSFMTTWLHFKNVCQVWCQRWWQSWQRKYGVFSRRRRHYYGNGRRDEQLRRRPQRFMIIKRFHENVMILRSLDWRRNTHLGSWRYSFLSIDFRSIQSPLKRDVLTWIRSHRAEYPDFSVRLDCNTSSLIWFWRRLERRDCLIRDRRSFTNRSICLFRKRMWEWNTIRK